LPLVERLAQPQVFAGDKGTVLLSPLKKVTGEPSPCHLRVQDRLPAGDHEADEQNHPRNEGQKIVLTKISTEMALYKGFHPESVKDGVKYKVLSCVNNSTIITQDNSGLIPITECCSELEVSFCNLKLSTCQPFRQLSSYELEKTGDDSSCVGLIPFLRLQTETLEVPAGMQL